jgi:CHAT domain-containing protein
MLSGAYLPEQIASFDREIKQLNDAADALDPKIRSLDPRFVSLAKPQPAKLKEIQDQLDADTVLIEYFLGETNSYVWLVTADAIEGHKLPRRADIETLARRVYESLSARGGEYKSPEERNARITKAESDFADSSSRLSEMILNPIAPRLGQKRLVVVADGALQTLPFGVLPVSGSPLLASNEMVSLPSASVLVLQRRELARRKPAPLPLAVLADPVFDAKDSRVAEAMLKRKPRKPTNNLPPLAPINSFQSRAVNALGEGGGIRRLQYSAVEANSIIAAARSTQTFKAVDFKASRTTAMSPELSRYRIVHLATHGVMNLSHPELSGVLLSMIDESGRPTNGYLGLSEIYNLNLPADLVVLSACETGIGKEIRGEGLIALTRGFMHAGAERVVASLWKVDDQATAILMGEFYKQMFENKLKPANALRVAQLKLSQQPAWRKPHFWAGFVLQGEWR